MRRASTEELMLASRQIGSNADHAFYELMKMIFKSPIEEESLVKKGEAWSNDTRKS